MTTYLSSSSSQRLKHGFTLIELLVVISIVGILVGLTIVGVGAVKGKAMTIKSASNLRQIFLAQMAYANDNDGLLATLYNDDDEEHLTWQARLIPYLESKSQSRYYSIFNSPYRKDFNDESATYGMNNYMMSPKDSWSGERLQWNYTLIRVKNLSRIILCGDMVQYNCDFLNTSDGKNWYTSGQSWGLPAYRHSGNTKAQMIFCDGHVELLSAAELEDEPKKGQSRWKWW